MMTSSRLMQMPTVLAEPSTGTEQLRQRVDRFLRSVERKALVMTQLRTSDPEAALDIVQDVMLAFVRRYQNKPEEQWPPLFYTALRNRITDWYRRRASRGRWLGALTSRFGGDTDSPQEDLIQQAPAAANADPAHRLADDQFGTALNGALQSLPERQREAFLLRSWQGFSTAETAAAMGCSEGSVKTHLSRATKALREQLGAYNDD